MVNREEARRIAEGEVKHRRLSSGIEDIFSLEEFPRRAPLIYGGPDLRRCWIAYATRSGHDLKSGTIVLVDRESGEVLYSGSTFDEG